MSRLDLTDDPLVMMQKMAGGSINAIQALSAIFINSEEIDPQAVLGAINPMVSMDSWEIHDDGISTLLVDKCNSDVRKMLVLIRGTQLGHLPIYYLQQMADDRQNEIILTEKEFATLNSKVCADLIEFRRA